MISGLTLNAHNLVALYVAALQALAHGTRHIVDSMNARGYKIDTIFLTGGMAKNELFVQITADVTRCRVVLAKQSEAVLLGSAILAAVASKQYVDLYAAMKAMNRVGAVFEATKDASVTSFHDTKHKIFHLQYQHQLELRKLEGLL